MNARSEHPPHPCVACCFPRVCHRLDRVWVMSEGKVQSVDMVENDDLYAYAVVRDVPRTARRTL